MTAFAPFNVATCRSIPRLKAEISATKACGCDACVRKLPAMFSRLKDLEEMAPPPAPVDDGYETVAGVRVPKAKRSRQQTRAHKIKSGKGFAKLMAFRQTTEGIARQQTRFDRLGRQTRGHVVRG